MVVTGVEQKTVRPRYNFASVHGLRIHRKDSIAMLPTISTRRRALAALLTALLTSQSTALADNPYADLAIDHFPSHGINETLGGQSFLDYVAERPTDGSPLVDVPAAANAKKNARKNARKNADAKLKAKAKADAKAERKAEKETDNGLLPDPSDDSAKQAEESIELPPPANSPASSSGPVAEPVAEPVTGSFAGPIVGAMIEPMTTGNQCTSCNSNQCTKKKRSAATDAMKSAYAGLFYANRFDYLNDPCYDGPSFLGDSLKGLFGNRLDIGGEARVRYHHENNMRGRVPGLRGGPSGLGLTNNDDDFYLTRVRLFANYQMTKNLRIFGEYLYADSGGEEFNNRPIEENRGEMQNLFVDAKLTDDLTARVGRQELLYGAQRLVSPLDWANTRRTFEGARGIYTGETWKLDGFFVHPVRRDAEHESKIDDADEDQDFYGVSASRSDLAMGSLEAYYLGYDNQREDFNYHTLGTRVYGKSDQGWLYEMESGVQFGDNSPGRGNHSAHYFTAGLGRQLNYRSWKPTLWLWYDFASGEDNFDDVARGDDGFDHLNPLAHKYLGFMDLFGRRNIQDFNLQLSTPIGGERVKFLLWYHYLRLDERTTPYDIVMQPYNTTSVAGSKELGHEIDCLFTIALNPRSNVLLGYSFFSAGDYYDTTANVPNNDADFFYAQFQTRF